MCAGRGEVEGVQRRRQQEPEKGRELRQEPAPRANLRAAAGGLDE